MMPNIGQHPVLRKNKTYPRAYELLSDYVTLENSEYEQMTLVIKIKKIHIDSGSEI